MSDPRDPVFASVSWEFPFAGHGASHVVLWNGVELPVTQVDASTARIELTGLELSRELYDSLAGAGDRLRVEHAAIDE